MQLHLEFAGPNKPIPPSYSGSIFSIDIIFLNVFDINIDKLVWVVVLLCYILFRQKNFQLYQ